MRKIMLSAALLSCVGCSGASTAPSAPTPASRGEAIVEPVVNKHLGGRLFPSVIVSYENTTGSTFRTAVTIQCDALSAGGGVIDTNQRSFFAREVGAIAPGFRGTVKVPWNSEVEVSSARCWISQAR